MFSVILPSTISWIKRLEPKKLWVTEDGKIGMDGGAVYGGVLHGILFDESGMKADVALLNEGFAAIDD